MLHILNTTALILALAVVLKPAISIAQDAALPVCIYTASDYDGDGFGWEYTGTQGLPGDYQFGSCQVTGQSVSMPSYTNVETGQSVNLVRPYWNAYRDFEGRTIQCDYHVSNENNQYVQGRGDLGFYYSNGFLGWGSDSETIEHFPLATNSPWYGYARNIAYDRNAAVTRVNYINPYTYWTVIDGIYYSNAGSQQSVQENLLSRARYVELIDSYNGAVRVWFGTDRYGTSQYADCYDTAGARFQPSGSMGESRPSAQTATDTLVVNAIEQVADAVVNLDTRAAINAQYIQWDLFKLYNQTIGCVPYRWIDDSEWAPYSLNEGFGYSSALSSSHAYYAPPETRYAFYAPDYQTQATYNTASGVYSYYEDFTGQGGEGEWGILNGVMSTGPLSGYQYAERVDNGYGATETRLWIDSKGYDVCTGIPEGALLLRDYVVFDTDSVQQQLDENTGEIVCIDSAPIGDGWGWDGTSSCRVASEPGPTPVDSNCDYSNAGLHGGWGWDPVARQSCPPQETEEVSDCDYSNAATQGGWGWDPVRLESCAPLTAPDGEGSTVTGGDTDCDYSVAELNGGWGWNPVTLSSCSPR